MSSPLFLPPRVVPSCMEAGVDEAGRGCLAGPVVAAAVILPADCQIEGLDDSKRLSAKARERLAVEIKGKAIAYAIAEASVAEIDRHNILQATYLAMNRAVEQLAIRPEFLLIDGNRFRTELGIPFKTIVGGDGKVASIAAASILAKTYRDALMCQLDSEYPGYEWHQNAGYGTKSHLQAIQSLGTTPCHRLTFGPCRPSLFTQEGGEGICE